MPARGRRPGAAEAAPRRGTRPAPALVVALVVGLVAAGCSGGPPPTLAAEDLPPPSTYVAVGASETVGVGADDPATGAWPSVLLRTAMARSVTLVNVGMGGATVRQALDRQLAPALAEEPRLVTVWLNVNDLVRAVPVAGYERDLAALVRALRRGGAAEVLVATTPPLLDLPVVRACLPGSGDPCRLPARLPAPEVVTAAAADYDAAIRRVAAAEGGIVVDLGAAGAAGTEGLVSADGFHPSTEGHRRVAAAFADALAGSPSAAELGAG